MNRREALRAVVALRNSVLISEDDGQQLNIMVV
jgi:hypothetical protein